MKADDTDIDLDDPEINQKLAAITDFNVDWVICLGCGKMAGDHLTCEDCGVRNCDVETQYYQCGRWGDGLNFCPGHIPNDSGCPYDNPQEYND